MDKKLKKVPEILLMGPGPSCVYPDVYDALSTRVLGHMDPVFLDIMDAIKEKCRSFLIPGIIVLSLCPVQVLPVWKPALLTWLRKMNRF